MEPSIDTDEQSTLLSNPNTEKNYLFDKVFFGMGLLGGIGVTIYKAVELTSETPTWLLLGTSVSLIVVTTFGVIRARSTNPVLESKLERVLIHTSDSTSTSELNLISQKICELSLLIPQPDNDGYSTVQLQADYSSANVLLQLKAFKDYLDSQNKQKANDSIASVNPLLIPEPSQELLEKTAKLEKELEQASKDLLAQNGEIEKLKSAILQNSKNKEIEDLDNKAKSEQQLNEIATLTKKLEQAQEDLSIKEEKNQELTNEIGDLNSEITSNRLQWSVAQQILGTSIGQPISIENLDKVRAHITNLLQTPSKSRANSTYSSASNSAHSTPTKFPPKLNLNF